MRKVLLTVCGLFLLFAGNCNAAVGADYDYPINDPLVATIIGTPAEYMADLPARIPVKKRNITIFPEHIVPESLWYEQTLRYSIAIQKGESPVVFVIAGTGAGYNSRKMQLLQKALFGAGYTVINISSPTHSNFIATASSSGTPGILTDDANDLYRVMDIIWQKEKKKIKATDFFLTGYSLGAAQSAFVAQIDEDRKIFNFKKVLMLNPPVSLYRSVKKLDAMLDDNATEGKDGSVTFFNEVMAKITHIYKEHDFVDFSSSFFYRIYQDNLDNNKKPKKEKMAALIGLSFRMSSANMILTADQMTNAGYVVPKNLFLAKTDAMTDYWIVSSRISFVDYVQEMLLSKQQKTNPQLTLNEMVENSSLNSIKDYLEKSDKIGLITNKDDVILQPSDIDFFTKTFKDRATIYPNGGHCGNMAHKDFVKNIISFLN